MRRRIVDTAGRHPRHAERRRPPRRERALEAQDQFVAVDEDPLVVRGLYELVAEIARSGVAVLVVEQFASAVMGLADQAAVMVHGRIELAGPLDAELLGRLSDLYLGGATPSVAPGGPERATL